MTGERKVKKLPISMCKKNISKIKKEIKINNFLKKIQLKM